MQINADFESRIGSVVDPDPHHFGNLDLHPDPHPIEKKNPHQDPDLHQSDKQDTELDPDQQKFADDKQKCMGTFSRV